MPYTAISLLLLARSQLNLMHFNATHPIGIDFLRANPPPCSLHFGVGSLCHSEADYENEPKISICSRGVDYRASHLDARNKEEIKKKNSGEMTRHLLDHCSDLY